ncbi:MAG: Tad domain-containing protein [bacterium]
MIRIFTRQIEKLGTEDGQALVFVAMVGLVIFLFFAMSVNLAELVNTKIKHQNAVDAAALSGAVWQARAFNLMAGTNENLLNLWAMVLVTIVTDAFLMALLWEACQGNFVLGCSIGLVLAVGQILLSFPVLIYIGQRTADQQTEILSAFGRELLDSDLGAGAAENILDLNYAFKENTVDDEKGCYYYARDVNGDLIDGYFERVTWCELIVSLLYYFSYQLDTPDEMRERWEGLRPVIAGWYSAGYCDPEDDLIARLRESYQAVFPYALKTKIETSPGVFVRSDLEPLMPISVGAYKEQEAPVLLGKGSGPPGCLPGEDTGSAFPCPDARHYAFATAHAFSESVSRFYNVAVAGITAPSHPIPLVPFRMDWEARLFPMDGNGSEYAGWTAYENIARQMEGQVGGAYDFLVTNILGPQGNPMFLY